MDELRRRILEALTALAGAVPKSYRMPNPEPRAAARDAAMGAARKAAALSGGSALVPGVGSTVLLVADLVAVLKIQQRMIADIAAIYGQSPSLTREVMIALLFKDTSPNAVRGLLVSHAGWQQPGGATLARGSNTFLRRALQKIAWGLARRLMGKAFARIVPVVGSVGAGIGSYRNTMAVAETAMAYFETRGVDAEPASARAALASG